LEKVVGIALFEENAAYAGNPSQEILRSSKGSGLAAFCSFREVLAKCKSLALHGGGCN
jgi:hypothetical protein